MAVPKRRTGAARRDKRRSPNMKMKAPGLCICPQCHQPKLPHRVALTATTMTVRVCWKPKVVENLKYSFLKQAERPAFFVKIGADHDDTAKMDNTYPGSL